MTQLLAQLTPKPEAAENSLMRVRAGEIASMSSVATARSSAKANGEIWGILERAERRGSYARIKRRGERGQPCLTPLRMGIQVSTRVPKKGVTSTLWRALFRKRETQGGKPALFRTARIQP
jgi:hypothetical protein